MAKPKKKPSAPSTKPIVAMRLSPAVVEAATVKAQKLGVSRTMYIDQVLRRDLGLDVLEIQKEAANGSSIFG